jgi:hypothetical protein
VRNVPKQRNRTVLGIIVKSKNAKFENKRIISKRPARCTVARIKRHEILRGEQRGKINNNHTAAYLFKGHLHCSGHGYRQTPVSVTAVSPEEQLAMKSGRKWMDQNERSSGVAATRDIQTSYAPYWLMHPETPTRAVHHP